MTHDDCCSSDLFAAAPPGQVFLPAIEFERGSERAPDEQPVRSISVDAFAIDRPR